MYPILREQFIPGPYERVFDGEDDDSGHDHQQGETLTELIETVLGEHVPFMETLEAAIQEQDPADVRDGDEPYFSDSNVFVERRPYLNDHYERWRRVQEELMHRRRFFSGEAKDLFGYLFENVELRKGRLADEQVRNVVDTLSAGTTLFRARRSDGRQALKKILSAPAAELGPPPAEFARAGRMNAEGVPVFYGALDKETCIAELRPSLGGDVAVGAFQITRPLRLLDFRLLESGYWGLKPLSYFQADFGAQVEKREFTRRLHRLIGAPVLPGQESEYLITQAMAEFLGHVREPHFDGVIFESAQREQGANLALFPTNFQDLEEGSESVALLKYLPNSVTLHRIRRVQYDSNEVSHFEDRSGEVYIYDPDARPEDD